MEQKWEAISQWFQSPPLMTLCPHRGMCRAQTHHQQVLGLRCPLQQKGTRWSLEVRETSQWWASSCHQRVPQPNLCCKESEITEQLLVNWSLGLALGLGYRPRSWLREALKQQSKAKHVWMVEATTKEIWRGLRLLDLEENLRFI